MRRRILHLLLVTSLFVSWSVAAPQKPYSMQGASASRPPKWNGADKEALLAKARRGDERAQFWLGTAYEQGWFGKTDLQAALRWLRLGAKHGDPDAENELGEMYKNGEGVPQNYVMAANWYRRAA
jgi:uncharacterized protein